MNGSSVAPSASSEGQRSFLPSSGCLDVASSLRSSRVPELCGDFPSTHRTDLDHDLSGPLAWLRSLAGPALLSLDASRSLPVWGPFPCPGGLCPLGPCPKRSLGSWLGSKFKVRATSRRLWCLLHPCPAVSCSPYLLRYGVETYLYWVTSSPKGFLWAMWSPVGGRCLPLPSLIHPLQPPHLKRINLIMFVS